jgi:hypothetical protein
MLIVDRYLGGFNGCGKYDDKGKVSQNRFAAGVGRGS